MDPDPWIYLWAFGGALAISLGLTPVALRIARRFDVLDHPGDYKVQVSPIPYLGGLAIVAAFSAAVLTAALFSSTSEGTSELALIVGLALGLSCVGLIDDLRGLHPIPRFALQVGAAIIVWASGIGVELFDVSILDALLTVLWIVGITNAFNLLDNMDGLSAGIAAIAAGFFLLLGATNGQFAIAALAASLAGCSLGFLKHNFHPARIYMGDAGSLFLGFMLAVIGIKLEFAAPQQVSFMVPVLVLGVAIMDTSLVVGTRIRHRLNPFIGGRDHISHRLVFIGIPVRRAVALVYAAGVGFGWLAIVMSRIDLTTGYILMGFSTAVAIFIGGMLATVPVYESSLRRKVMIREVSEHEEHSEPDKATLKVARS